MIILPEYDTNKFKKKDILTQNKFPQNKIVSLFNCVKNRKRNCPKSVNLEQPDFSIDVNSQPNVTEAIDQPNVSDIFLDGGQSYPFLESSRMIDHSQTIIVSITKTFARVNSDVKMAPRPPLKLSKIFTKTKDTIPKLDKAGVVYEIPCKSCEKSYIGETIQKLGQRIRQHERSCDVTNNKALTALSKHARDTQHVFDFDKTRILVNENYKNKLQIQ